ncbi:MAG: ATP-grasp domain-containing protein [Anaerolineaceae bacterium]|nr:ATP-grasp domain-containing protein [Anaerolineaceae bacterium]
MGVSVRAMAESAVASGYEVAGLDAFGDLDLQTICECYSLRRDYHVQFTAEGLYKASQGLAYDSVVYTANLENHPEVVGRLAKRSPVVGNSPKVLRNVRNWRSVSSALRLAGFRTPATYHREDAQQPDPNRKWLVKPMRGGGGHGVAFWPAGKKLGQGWMIQEYISGMPCSAAFVSNGVEAVVIGMSEQLIGLPEFGGNEFMYCGNIMPLACGDDSAYGLQILEQVRQIATMLTREFGLVGVNGIDFILTNGEVCLLEVNPRYSSSMELMEQAYHLPIFDLHVRSISSGELPDFDLANEIWSNRRTAGKVILYANKDGQVPNIRTWIDRGIRDVPHVGEKLLRGKPICTVLAVGSTRNECYSRLTAEVDRLNGEIFV